MKIRLFYNEKKDNSFIGEVLSTEFKKANIELTNGNDYEIGISIGGDGTFIRMISESDFNEDALFIGINNGTLGFLQEVMPNEIIKLIDSIVNKKYKVEELTFERIIVKSKNGVEEFKALNEVVIREESLRTAYFDVLINDELLENYVGDGIMISTPTGSTSYNLSCNGAIVYRGLEVLEITPLAPINNYVYHTLSNSVIVPDDYTIKIVPTKRTKNLSVFVDGHNYPFEEIEEITTFKNNNKIKIMHIDEGNYTSIVYNKFLK